MVAENDFTLAAVVFLLGFGMTVATFVVIVVAHLRTRDVDHARQLAGDDDE